VEPERGRMFDTSQNKRPKGAHAPHLRHSPQHRTRQRRHCSRQRRSSPRRAMSQKQPLYFRDRPPHRQQIGRSASNIHPSAWQGGENATARSTNNSWAKASGKHMERRAERGQNNSTNASARRGAFERWQTSSQDNAGRAETDHTRSNPLPC
jgi:hypothetical protein